MGYRGKVRERDQARRLRANGLTMNEIARRLGVSKSSVSLWTRDVIEYVPHRKGARNAASGGRHPLQLARLRQIEALNRDGIARIGVLNNQAFLVAGVALYAAEGAKTDRAVQFASTDPRMVRFFLAWLRRFFDIDESRLRVRLYLHDGLDLDTANRFWSELTGIPVSQFCKPYRAVPDPSIRHTKHEMGCPAVFYSCGRTHRSIMGLVRALLNCNAVIPG